MKRVTFTALSLIDLVVVYYRGWLVSITLTLKGAPGHWAVLSC